ncbi:fibroblast growth factor 21 [Phascolarctos cinereus]|uniref:Fibroblast growth factor n=1 Tax=Phascolarctos cinereus TaxID=38626 RepID=A0A6P5LKI7_PHACI|nr:fibroblast growth factor 21 [Phascolarctos cinereus]
MGPRRRARGCLAPLLSLLLAYRGWGYPIPDSSPMLLFGGQVRLRHLYTDDGQDTEAHVEMGPDGAVRAAVERSPDSLLELKAVKPGVIRILAVHSSRFLCMRPSGELYGAVQYDPSACNFREHLLGDGYNVYESEAHGRTLRLSPQASLGQPGPSRFLPLPGAQLPGTEPPWGEGPEPPDVGSADPLSMVGGAQGRSPSYSS